jgi:signal peptidase I
MLATMANKKIIRRVVLGFSGVLLCLCLSLAGQHPVVHAQDSLPSDIGSGNAVAPLPTANCSGLPFSGLASFTIPNDRYDIYARLGSTSTPETDTLYVQDAQQNCHTLGSAPLVNDRWVKIGSYDAATNGGTGTLQLASYTAGVLQSFNQPSILLVSQTNPACQPTAECTVTVDGQQGEVRPDVINGSNDTLFVVRAVNPAQDQIKKVDYFVDNHMAYSLPILQSFNLRYVSAGKHTLDTIVHYKSGQRVIITKVVTRDWVSYGFFSYLAGLFFNQEGLLQYVFGLSLLLLIISLILRLLHGLHHRARWRRDHDARITQPLLGERLRLYFESHLHPHIFRSGSWIVGLFKWLIRQLPVICAGLLIVVLLNKYLISIKQVDGPSMNSTFASGNPIIVNRLGQTYGALVHQGYTPKRGDVVVFRRVLDVNNPNSSQGSELLIKRVIGLPGDHVVANGVHVTIYNSAHPNGYQPDIGSAWQTTMHLDSDSFGSTNPIDVTLQPGEVFVCGDNRPESIDSRALGPIQTKDILGNVVLKM